MTSEFHNTFAAWLEASLSSSIPDEVVAYTFNLVEPWCIEVVGCERYDAEDPDWACDEVFRPEQSTLALPSDVFGDNWETVLERSIEMLSLFLEQDNHASRILKGSQAVAIGFVDGELHLIWAR